jgi:hypothetical protein
LECLLSGGAQDSYFVITEFAAAFGAHQSQQSCSPGPQQSSRVGIPFQHGQICAVEPITERLSDRGDQRLGQRANAHLALPDLARVRTRRSNDARSVPLNSTGCNPAGATIGSRANVSASIPLLLA